MSMQDVPVMFEFQAIKHTFCVRMAQTVFGIYWL